MLCCSAGLVGRKMQRTNKQKRIKCKSASDANGYVMMKRPGDVSSAEWWLNLHYHFLVSPAPHWLSLQPIPLHSVRCLRLNRGVQRQTGSVPTRHSGRPTLQKNPTGVCSNVGVHFQSQWFTVKTLVWLNHDTQHHKTLHGTINYAQIWSNQWMDY